jgi:hypothetical protein
MNDDNDLPAGPREWRRHRRENRTPIESIGTGLAIIAGSAVFWYFNQHAWWMVFMAVFGGLIPVVKGVSRLIESRVQAPKEKRLSDAQRGADNERAVLRIAQSRAGLVSASQVALETQLSLEEASTLLDSLAKRGHASMEVMDDGRIVYRFPDLISH